MGFGTGGLGSGIDGGKSGSSVRDLKLGGSPGTPTRTGMVKQQVLNLEEESKDASSSKVLDAHHDQDQSPEEDDTGEQCPNCKAMIKGGDDIIAMHTVQCYRNSTKCKVCNEVIQRDQKKEHLAKWRREEVS